jgi:5'-nucleotidase / UDP-sugar diphosphatase
MDRRPSHSLLISSIVATTLLTLVATLTLAAPVRINHPRTVQDSAPRPAAVPLTVTEGLTVTILHTNDVHAHVDEWATGGITYGGAARLATEIGRIRATESNVILLDAGDQFMGTLFYRVFLSNVITATMNALGYDAMVVGNHEFDDTESELWRFTGGAAFPVLGANVVDHDPGWPPVPLKATTVITVAGQAIGVVGLTTPDTAERSSASDQTGFLDPVVTARGAVADFTARGIDKVIALTHLGYGADLALARAVPGLDVIVGGHSHTFLHTPPDAAVGPYPTVVDGAAGTRTLVVTAGEWGRYLGHLVVSFDGDGHVAGYGGNPIQMDATVPKDPAVEALVASYRGPIEALRAEIIGESDVEIPIRVGTDLVCRIGECLMGDLVADAVLDSADGEDWGSVDLAIINGGSLRAPLAAGPISVGDVMEVLPFGNTLSTFAITGTYILQALENGVSLYPEQSGRFPQVSGLRFEWNPGRPAGARITSAQVWEVETERFRPLDPAAVYTVATNDFLRRGGDGYSVFRDHAIDPYDFGAPLDQVLIDYLSVTSPMAELDGRIAPVRWTAFVPLALDSGTPYMAPPLGGDEYAILHAAIVHQFADDPDTRRARFVIHDETARPFTWDDVTDNWAYLKENLPDLEKTTYDAFMRRNTAAHRLEDRFGLRTPVALISEAEIEAIFTAGGDGWARFYGLYPGSQGIMDVSRPGISPDGRQAIVYVGNQSHYLAGAGIMYLLTFADGVWTTVGSVMLWIS